MIERSTKSPTKLSNLARVIFTIKCLGPVVSAVIYGKLISVSKVFDNSILAFSQASLTRCFAIESLNRLIPCSFSNSSTT